MNTFVVESEIVRIPARVTDLDSFRRWAQSDDFPETGRICYLNGEVWVDMSKEQFFSHNQVKGEFNVVLGGLTKQERLGRYVPDGMLLSSDQADLSCQPDGAFFSFECLRTGRVKLIEGVREGFVELQGSPDMVLEVVSTSSVEKDTVLQPDLYWKAGIQEYWLVDARGDAVKFEILRHSPDGYVSVEAVSSWVASQVFERSFRLTRQTDTLGHPEITLEYR